ncbi:MAG: histidine phosphatase family protein [Ruminococcus sp.]
MKGYRISVIRHGRTAANDKGFTSAEPIRFPTRAQPSLPENDSSISQCGTVPATLRRCTETAEILFPDVQIQTVDNLIEMDFGAFEGKSADELVEKPEFKEWLKGGMDCRPPQGESVKEVQLRIFKALREIITDMMREDLLHCAMITHGGMIANMLAGFGLPKISPQECSASRVRALTST